MHKTMPDIEWLPNKLANIVTIIRAFYSSNAIFYYYPLTYMCVYILFYLLFYLFFMSICNYYSPVSFRKISSSHSPTVILNFFQSSLVQKQI